MTENRKLDVPTKSSKYIFFVFDYADPECLQELKKDPGVPRLPSLKARNASKQHGHPVSSVIRAVPYLAHHMKPPRLDPDQQMASEPTLSSLAALAASSSTVDDNSYTLDPSSSKGAPKTKEQLRRHYVRELHKVIDQSDIIVLVLDARDPEGCRSRLVEEEVRRRESEGKRLVFVLNKVGACHTRVPGHQNKPAERRM